MSVPIKLKGVKRPASFAIFCFCFCQFQTVSYSGSCTEHVANFAQSMLVFVLSLNACLDLNFLLKIQVVPCKLCPIRVTAGEKSYALLSCC